ncbi:MAG: formylglycine-generating enzyme family protein [Treponema sp.]|nr:formylglycine-generating enzyme family protein [Treponema sp.]
MSVRHQRSRGSGAKAARPCGAWTHRRFAYDAKRHAWIGKAPPKPKPRPDRAESPAYRRNGNTIVCDFNATGYRLPTEAEWEYAAKGGSKGSLSYEYSGGNNANAVAWYTNNSRNRTHPVGTKQPNSLGIYDMTGNVWEWCWDWYGSYSRGNQSNPTGESSGTTRIGRGGGWNNRAAFTRVASRSRYSPSHRLSYLGFRLVRPWF